jgi:hypothetical protein
MEQRLENKNAPRTEGAVIECLWGLAARRLQGYSVTVCTTLLTGRVLATGSLMSLIMASS